jgi:hypothetical protein
MATAAAKPVTLSDLICDDRLLWIYCRDCYHERDVNPANAPVPGDTPVPDIGKRMKCSKCGSKKISTTPEQYPGGVMAMRARRLDS